MRLARRVIAIFVIGQFGLLGCVNGAESNRIAVVVNKYLKQEIDDNLSIYLQDLRDEGYEPVLKEWDLENNPAPKALKVYLKGLYLGEGSLQGAVFIGDLPIPIMEANPILKEGIGGDTSLIRISDGYIAERYYMDLVGKEWIENAKNYTFEEPDYESYWESFLKTVEYYTPEALKQMIGQEGLYPMPEIWTSRIVTSTLTALFKKSEGELVNAYLEKNHAYRTGQVVFQKQTLLYSLPQVMKFDRAFSENRFIEPRRILSKNYELKEPIPAPATIDEFFKLLSAGSYEVLFWGRHGLKTYINLGSGDLRSSILASTPVNVRTAFVFPASCWIGHYVEPSYFAGSYLFNERYYVIGMPTATLPSYGGQEVSAMSNFVEGGNLGLAFKKAIEIPDISLAYPDIKHLSSKIASSNSRFILGDGTLRLQSKGLIVHEINSPQKYLTEKYPYSEEFLYDYVKLKGKDAEELADVETVNLFFKTAFEKNDYKMFNTLIDKGANIRATDQEGNTLLHLAAAEKKDRNIIDLLVKSGLDMRTENAHGKTPWDIAKENGNDIAMFDAVIKNGTIEQIKFLIEDGADVNSKNQDNNNDTPLHIAAGRGDIEIIKILLENGADVNAASADGSTPLILSHGPEALKLLIENGADVNAKNGFGNTRLHLAAHYGKTELMRILIENGADVNVKNNLGQTPWDMTTEGVVNAEALELLKNAGAETK